jgi:hypothetical protein
MIKIWNDMISLQLLLTLKYFWFLCGTNELSDWYAIHKHIQKSNIFMPYASENFKNKCYIII